ncbi:MAG: hypothetical protein ACK4JB_21845 [Reyranella sp.]
MTLTKQIDDALNFNSPKAPTELMRCAISLLGHRNDSQIVSKALFEQAHAMRAALKTQVSIDYFLYSRADQPDFELLGKMAIAACLLTAESKCTALLPRHPGESIDLSQSESTWLARLFQNVLAPGVRKSEMETIFDNVSFVVFNYDRCIEHYLTNALASHFSIRLPDAASIVRDRLKIVHPYGSLGPLGDSSGCVPFGHKFFPESYEAADGIYAMSRRLLTFTESQNAKADDAKAMMEHAVRVVFLGFGFGNQNMDLLRPNRTNIQEIRGTVKNVSVSNQREVARQIYTLTGQTISDDDLLDCDCSALILDEEKFLTRS